MDKRDALLKELTAEYGELERKFSALSEALMGERKTEDADRDMAVLMADQLSAMRLYLGALGRRAALLKSRMRRDAKSARHADRKRADGCRIVMTDDELRDFLAELGLQYPEDRKPGPFEWAERSFPETYTYTITCGGDGCAYFM